MYLKTEKKTTSIGHQIRQKKNKDKIQRLIKHSFFFPHIRYAIYPPTKLLYTDIQLYEGSDNPFSF